MEIKTFAVSYIGDHIPKLLEIEKVLFNDSFKNGLIEVKEIKPLVEECYACDGSGNLKDKNCINCQGNGIIYLCKELIK